MKKGKNKAGFTMIEVMIALAVLMIGLVGIVGVQIAGIHQLAQAKQRTAATQLSTQVMETLKNTPINATDPSVIFSDGLGVQQVDADGAALLDDTAGDGKLTWHRLRPMKADGAILTDDNWSSEFFYMAVYGVEWGGAAGSKFLNAGSNDPLVLAQYPDTVPGANEIYIEVWVLWVDPGMNPQTVSGVTLHSVWDYYNNINSSFPVAPSVVPKKKLVMRTIRR